ncbi:hypothetical protein, partial [Marisediminicola antarctica]
MGPLGVPVPVPVPVLASVLVPAVGVVLVVRSFLVMMTRTAGRREPNMVPGSASVAMRIMPIRASARICSSVRGSSTSFW